MDQPPSEHHKDNAAIGGICPDMRMSASDRSVSYADTEAPAGPSRLPAIVGIVAGIVGLAAIATSAWVYVESRQEIVRLSTEIAQLRVSLDLYARGNAPTQTTAIPDADLVDLSSRVSILEENWRSGAAPVANTPAPAAARTTASGDDCLPSGMRILVAAGDSYPVCELDTTIEIAAVDNGYVTLVDGTTIPSGGTIPLIGTSCTLGVTSSGDEGLTGYGEIRVNC